MLELRWPTRRELIECFGFCLGGIALAALINGVAIWLWLSV